MASFHVTCHTPDNSDHDRRIQGLGGAPWGWLDIDTIIWMIDKQGHTFYTRSVYGVDQAIIVAVHPRSGRQYLKTRADGVEPNNILSLPRCQR